MFQVVTYAGAQYFGLGFASMAVTKSIVGATVRGDGNPLRGMSEEAKMTLKTTTSVMEQLSDVVDADGSFNIGMRGSWVRGLPNPSSPRHNSIARSRNSGGCHWPGILARRK